MLSLVKIQLPMKVAEVSEPPLDLLGASLSEQLLLNVRCLTETIPTPYSLNTYDTAHDLHNFLRVDHEPSSTSIGDIVLVNRSNQTLNHLRGTRYLNQLGSSIRIACLFAGVGKLDSSAQFSSAADDAATSLGQPPQLWLLNRCPDQNTSRSW